jgi:ParB-like chromosome segregation protein Spo0J
MKWHATKRIAIKSIVLPGNFAATKAAARVTDLATSLRETDGPIHSPVIEQKTNRLLAGHDRVAAMIKLKETHVEARFWSGTPQEFRRVQLMENLHRRHDDRNALIAELARTEEAQVSETQDLTQPAVSTAVDTPRTASDSPLARKAAANAAVAAVAGIKPRSVAQAKARAKSSAKAATPDVSATSFQAGPVVAAEPVIPLPAGFETFGLEVEEDRERITQLVADLGDWDSAVRKLLGELTVLEHEYEGEARPILPPATFARLRDAAHALGHLVREAIPTSLCFYCKAQRALQQDCPACAGTGYVGRHGGDSVPPELKTGGAEARVAVAGRFVLIANVVESAAGTPMEVSAGFREALIDKARVIVRRELTIERADGTVTRPSEIGAQSCLCGHAFAVHDDENAGGGGCSQCTCEMFEVKESADLDDMEPVFD